VRPRVVKHGAEDLASVRPAENDAVMVRVANQNDAVMVRVANYHDSAFKCG
jgi:hypothetical protein